MPDRRPAHSVAGDGDAVGRLLCCSPLVEAPLLRVVLRAFGDLVGFALGCGSDVARTLACWLGPLVDDGRGVGVGSAPADTEPWVVPAAFEPAPGAPTGAGVREPDALTAVRLSALVSSARRGTVPSGTMTRPDSARDAPASAWGDTRPPSPGSGTCVTSVNTTPAATSTTDTATTTATARTHRTRRPE